MTMPLTQIKTGGVDDNINIDSNTLKVDGTNNRVGIGTAAPGTQLEIAGSASTLLRLDSSNGNGGVIRIRNGGADKHFFGSAADFMTGGTANQTAIRSNSDILFGISGNEKARLDSSGNFGIGVSSLSSSSRLTLLESAGNAQTLEIKGANSGGVGSQPGIKFTASTGANIGGIFGDTNSDAVVIQSGGSERLRISSDGNLGLGTSSFTATSSGRQILEINGTSGSLINLDVGGTRKAYHFTDGTHLYSYNTANGSYIFGTNNAEKARLDSSGRLLVGSTTSTHNIANQSKQAIVITGDLSQGGLDITGYTGGSSTGRCPEINFNRSLGTTDGSVTALSAAPWHLGSINFSGATGSGFGLSAQIRGVTNSTTYSGSNSGGELRFYTTANGATSTTERIKIESDGTVLVTSASANKGIELLANGSRVARFAVLNPGVDHTPYIGSVLGNDFYFMTNNTERMRISSSGAVGIGTTSPGHKLDVSSLSNVARFHNTDSSDHTAIVFQHARGLSGFAGKMVSMRRNDGTEVGSIVIGVSSTAYNTSSDYRLKENVVDIDGAINRVKQLTPRRFNFIDDADRIVDGFIAHEAQVVVPEAVTGTHNQVDDDGNAVMQGIDQSKLVPLLTAALQEAIAKIESLEAKVAALEAG